MARNLLMIHVPKKKNAMREEMVERMVLNVIYRKTFSHEKSG